MTYYNGEDFDSLIKNGIHLVDFYAPWCGPCKMLGTVLETLEDVDIIKINIDDYPEFASRFKILTIPRLIFFKDGEVVNDIIGFVDKETICEKLLEINNL